METAHGIEVFSDADAQSLGKATQGYAGTPSYRQRYTDKSQYQELGCIHLILCGAPVLSCGKTSTPELCHFCIASTVFSGRGSGGAWCWCGINWQRVPGVGQPSRAAGLSVHIDPAD